MKTGVALVGFFFSAAIGLAAGYALRGLGDAPPSKQADSPPSAARVAPVPAAEDVYKVPVGSSLAKGPADALITIVEFSDFECPFCARVQPTLDQIFKAYPGEVRLAFKHQPLPFHRKAPLASEYALAAGEQGKFWEMHDKLFQNQRQIDEADLKGYAKALGLDQAKIDAYIASGKGKKVIADDQALAQQVGATGTPAFFINGVKVSGAQPFENFKKVLDEAKARAEAAVQGGTKKADVYAALIAGGRTSPPPPPAPAAPPPQTRQKLDLVEGTPAKGSQDPLLVIVEFSDFECPFCSRVNPTIKQVLETYGDDVQVQFRNQPLSFHKNAMPAAKAALAAHRQGKFWEMHDKLFENQKALSADDLTRYARELNLDEQKFASDMQSPEVAAMIEKDQADANRVGARGTPTLFVNGVPIRGAQPFPAFQTVIDKELAAAKELVAKGVKRKDVYGKMMEKAGETVDQPSAQPAQPAAPPPPAKPVDVAIGEAPTYGKADAPVQIVVFSDFECPFCSRVNPSIDQLKKAYGDKISVSFKHFPLSFHPNAKPASVASLAAHRQGKFWEMHDKLFENQRALSREDFLRYAKELQLDVEKFEKDLDDPALDGWVDSDIRQGGSVGVRGTPATFVNGRLVSGAQPFEAFKTIVEEELKKRS